MHESVYHYVCNPFVSSIHVNLSYAVGPSIVPGISEQGAALDSSFSLLCGTNLQGNPTPHVSWLDPKGNNISLIGNPRYHPHIHGTEVMLEIKNFNFLDQGIWTCILQTEGFNISTTGDGSSSSVVPRASIGEIVSISITATAVSKDSHLPFPTLIISMYRNIRVP